MITSEEQETYLIPPQSRNLSDEQIPNGSPHDNIKPIDANRKGFNDDSTKNSTFDDNELGGQSEFGLQFSQINQRSLSKQDLANIRQQKSDTASSRHGLPTSLNKQLGRQGLLRDFFLNIDDFYDCIRNQQSNQLQVTLPSYQISYYEKNFKEALINWLNNALSYQNAIVAISIEDVFLEYNSKKFIIKKAINIMKSLNISSSFVESVRILTFKDKITDTQIKTILRKFNDTKINELNQKFQGKYKTNKKNNEIDKNKLLKTKSASLKKPSIGKENSFFYEINKTEFKEKNIQNLKKIRQEIEMKILVIKFHFRMLRVHLLNVTNYQRQLCLRDEYAFKRAYEKMKKPKTNQQEIKLCDKKTNNKDKFQLEYFLTLDQEERLFAEIQCIKKKLKDFEDDIISIVHVNTAISQFLKLLNWSQIPMDYHDQIFKIEATIHQTVMYFESIIVTEIQFIKFQKLVPQKCQDSIEFLMNQDEVLQFIQILDQPMIQYQHRKYQIPKIIKKQIPQIKLMLSYSNETSFLLDHILEKYYQDLQDSLKGREKGKISQLKKINKKSQIPVFIEKFNWKELVRNLFAHLAMYNFVIVSYHFLRQEPFNLNYFCIKEGITSTFIKDQKMKKSILKQQKIKQIEQQTTQNKEFVKVDSKTMKKVYFFWKTYEKPLLLRRIYESGTLSFKQIHQLRNGKQFNFQRIFNNYVDLNEIRQYKIRYLVHFGQFYLEIVSELSSAQNTSLAAVFNVCRFLLLNFSSFLYIQSVKRIQKEIKQKLGEFYYHALKKEIKNNKRILENEVKTIEAVRTSGQKIKRYIKQMIENTGQIGTNVKKLDKIFYEFPEMKKLFEKLNCTNPIKNQVNLKKPQEALQMEYDFTIVKQCYIALVKLMLKDYLSRSVMQRMLKKTISIKEEQINLVRSNAGKTDLFWQCKQFQPIKKLQKEKLDLFLKEKTHDSKDCYQIYFQKFAICFLQMCKLSTLILSLPFYSYENEVEYMRKRRIQKDLQKQLGRQNGNILYTLDQLYIFERSRINVEFMKKHSKNFYFVGIFSHYMKKVNEFLNFVQLKNGKEKDKYLKRQIGPINIESQLCRYPKYLHNETTSIYSKLQLQDFFFAFNQQESDRGPFKLESSFKKVFDEFIEICKEMEMRAKAIYNLILRAEKLRLKKGNIQPIKQVQQPSGDLDNSERASLNQVSNIQLKQQRTYDPQQTTRDATDKQKSYDPQQTARDATNTMSSLCSYFPTPKDKTQASVKVMK